jgi:hypothetical protein
MRKQSHNTISWGKNIVLAAGENTKTFPLTAEKKNRKKGMVSVRKGRNLGGE